MKTNIILEGDVIEKLKELPENSVDSVVTDPPYGIGFMGKEWDNFNPAKIEKAMNKDKRSHTRIASQRRSNTTGTYDLSRRGMLGFQNWVNQWASECLRVLKPGGFLLSFGGTRTYHRLVCGIEDAGFEIRDCIQWLYGSGFPKSLDIGQDFDRQECRKQLIKKLGRKPTREEFKKVWENFRKVVGKKDYTSPKADNSVKASSYGISGGLGDYAGERIQQDITMPTTEEAKQWSGWGTALKPANEPIVVARKPLSEKSVALNVLKWGTGGINIDGCRIGTTDNLNGGTYAKNPTMKQEDATSWSKPTLNKEFIQPTGRFPANIILDEEAAKLLDEQSGEVSQGHWAKSKVTGFGEFGGGKQEYYGVGEKDKTKHGASRFFYCAKASKSERDYGCEGLEAKEQKITNQYEMLRKNGTMREIPAPRKNNHPTVKPVQLMQYLVRLVTPKGGIVLDPFIGSGTTAIASLKEGFRFIGIEKNKEYIEIANARLKPYLEQKRLQ